MRLLNVAVTRARDKLLVVANIRHIRQEPSSSLCRRLYSWPVLATYYIRSKPRHKVYIIRTYFLRASQKSPSRSKQPSKRLVGVRGEAPDLPSDVRHLMGIHQGEHHGVQDREHLGYRRKVNPTANLPQRDIAPKVGADFHASMITSQLQQFLRRTPLVRETGPAIDHFDAVLVSAFAFPLGSPYF